jgi:hypothetical protein
MVSSYLAIASLFVALCVAIYLAPRTQRRCSLPPGPKTNTIPFLGSFHMLRTLKQDLWVYTGTKLKKQFGKEIVYLFRVVRPHRNTIFRRHRTLVVHQT